ncbi:hypothetical protein BDR26DRAFT_61759 [Obelidium mucronatum]|nr:hypothetical protein BDR26DRAFT_61759 [Obelidium mucronatum]
MILLYFIGLSSFAQSMARHTLRKYTFQPLEKDLFHERLSCFKIQRDLIFSIGSYLIRPAFDAAAHEIANSFKEVRLMTL